MDKQAEEILAGINKPVAADATSVSIGNEAPDQASRFNAMEKAGILQAAAVLVSPFFGKKVKKQGGVNVFSGFDGASGAQTGLRKAGVPINKYYASEIDKDAIGFTQHNYPETIQLGDIRNVDLSKLEPMDYGFFGFPCQSLSSANHNGDIGLRDMTTGKVLATLDDYEAAKDAGHELSSSSLFYEALKQAMVLKKKNPDVRLVFENVASMKPEFRGIIDKNLKLYLDLDPSFEMNTKGPTNRQRYLWTNAITRDDYNALSERMRQVMPDDIIDQNAHHELSAKGAKDNQTDLFEDKGGEVSPDGKFEAKTNKWLKSKLSTAAAGDGAGKLTKNGLEYNMTKKEMNRSQGNPDNLGLDYSLSDRKFAKLIGNGWDQFQFKPIFDRIAMEAKGNIPKSEGRLGDENAIARINEKYQPEGARKYIKPRLYHSRAVAVGENSLDPPASRDDVGTMAVALQDIPSDPFTAYPAEVKAKIARLITSAPNGLSRRKLNEYIESKLSPADMQRLEMTLGREYDNFRPGLWFATGKQRLNKYGDINVRLDIPPRTFERMLNEGTASVRPSDSFDTVVNIFEPIPTSRLSNAYTGSRDLSPARPRFPKALQNFVNTSGMPAAAQYDLVKMYGDFGHTLSDADFVTQIINLPPIARGRVLHKYPTFASFVNNKFPVDTWQLLSVLDSPYIAGKLANLPSPVYADLRRAGVGTSEEGVKRLLRDAIYGAELLDDYPAFYEFIKQLGTGLL